MSATDQHGARCDSTKRIENGRVGAVSLWRAQSNFGAIQSKWNCTNSLFLCIITIKLLNNKIISSNKNWFYLYCYFFQSKSRRNFSKQLLPSMLCSPGFYCNLRQLKIQIKNARNSRKTTQKAFITNSNFYFQIKNSNYKF
jgi:hypothetical protein